MPLPAIGPARSTVAGLVPALLLALSACPPEPAGDDDASVDPPDDDDNAESCEEDLDCSFENGLEICSDEGFCVEGDRNNALEEAQLVAYNSTVSLHIAPAGDVDWFRFLGDRGDLVFISTLGEDTDPEDTDKLDTVIRYFDAAGSEIAFNDNFDRVSTTLPDARLYTAVPEDGSWYFTVEDKGSWSNDPADPPTGGRDHGYDLTLVLGGTDSTVAIGQEPNDIADDATPWEVTEFTTNYTFGGFLEPAGDQDWISVDVSAGEILRVYGFPDSGSEGVAAVSILLPDAVSEIGTWEGLGWGDSERAWIPVLEDGPYFLRVEDSEGGGGWDHWYYLHSARNPSDDGFPPEIEPNDAAAEAQDLGLLFPEGENLSQTTLWGRVGEAGDSDWFAVLVPEGARLTAGFARTLYGETTELHLQVLDPEGDLVAEGDWSGPEEDNVISLLELPEGTNHLVLTEQDPKGGAPDAYYQLSVSLLRADE
jgi:hypothetical protein